METLFILLANSIFLLFIVIILFIFFSTSDRNGRKGNSRKYQMKTRSEDLKKIKEEVNEDYYL